MNKLDIEKFKKIHLVIFQDNEEFSIREFHGELLAKDIQLKNFINQTKWNYSSIEDVKKNIKNNTAITRQ